MTFNVRDFTSSSGSGDELPYEVLTPDELFVLIDDSNADLVRAAISRQIAYWITRVESVDLPEQLIRARCPVFAARVRGHLTRTALSGR